MLSVNSWDAEVARGFLNFLAVLAVTISLAQKRMSYSCLLGPMQTFPDSLASELILQEAKF